MISLSPRERYQHINHIDYRNETLSRQPRDSMLFEWPVPSETGCSHLCEPGPPAFFDDVSSLVT